MAELKTRPGRASVAAFLNAIPDPDRRRECQSLARLMTRLTGEKPRLWGDAIVGFGEFHYRYDSGHEGSWFLTGFSPRKRDLTVYVMAGLDHPDLMPKLGRYKAGRSCLYLKSLDDVRLPVLTQLVRRSIADLARRQRAAAAPRKTAARAEAAARPRPAARSRPAARRKAR